MKAIAEIQILPVGSDNAAVQAEVERAQDILVASGLRTEVHRLGTDIEGEIEEVFDALKQLHQHLHRCGVLRLSTVIKLGTQQTERQPVIRKVHEPVKRAEPSRRIEPLAAVQAATNGDGSDSFVTVWQIASPAR
jgi:uncharacterized protein (TIGR00106 family)